MKVLIIDDEALIRSSLSRVLLGAGHEVFTAENGITGLEVWRSKNPEVVILDVIMPGLTGPQVLQQMKNNSAARVILISAYSGDFDLKKANELGAEMFVEKPFVNIFDFVTILGQNNRHFVGD